MSAAGAICRRRLAGQLLLDRSATSAAAIVRALGAVQAQDYAGAKWAIAQRSRGLTEADIERELADGHVVRTHVLRPTWHFVAAGDARWMLELTAPRVRQFMAYHGRLHEITPALLARSRRAVTRALEGGRALTRRELAEALTRARIANARGQRLAHIVMGLELDGLIASGPRRGAQFTYALLAERAPHAKPLDRDEALLELARRYWTTRSPATARDFAWWSGLTVADAKRAIAVAGPELRAETLDAREYWTHVDAPDPPRGRASAHLLPNYDEYFIGYRDRGAIGERLGSSALVTGGNALIGNVIVVDGQLVGKWKLVRRGERKVALEPLVKLSAAEKSRVEREVRRHAAFRASPPKAER